MTDIVTSAFIIITVSLCIVDLCVNCNGPVIVQCTVLFRSCLVNWLETLVSKMSCYVSIGTLNFTQSFSMSASVVVSINGPVALLSFIASAYFTLQFMLDTSLMIKFRTAVAIFIICCFGH